jgi:mannosyltransferase
MPRREGLILAGVIVLAAVVRFSTLDLQSFHHDEAVTAGRVLNSNLFETFEVVIEGERSPPLYYLLAWLWSKLFGTGEAGLRSLSALIGTAMVPAGYLAGRELVSRRAGLLLAAFIALNPYLVWYSQEARSYILMTFFATLALALFARVMRTPSSRSLTMWALFSGLALTSHYFAVFLVIPMAVWLLAAALPDRRRATLAVTAVGLAGLALAPLAAAQQGGDRRDGFTERSLVSRSAELGLNYVASEWPRPLAGSRTVDVVQLGAGGGGALLFAGALALVVARGSPRERQGALLAGSVGAAAVGVPLLMALSGVDFFNPRNLIAAAVPLLAVSAIGFGVVQARRWGIAGGVATMIVFAGVVTAVTQSEQMQRPNWRGAAEAIGEADAPRLIVTPANGDDPLLYYLDARRFASRFDEGVRIREIAVLSTTFGITPPPGFRRVEKRGLAPLFILWRFESARPRLVTPRDVLGRRILRERDAALIDGIR